MFNIMENNLLFTKKNDKIIPVNPLLKMVCYYGIDDKKIIVYKKDYAYLYDIVNNKVGRSVGLPFMV